MWESYYNRPLKVSFLKHWSQLHVTVAIATWPTIWPKSLECPLPAFLDCWSIMCIYMRMHILTNVALAILSAGSYMQWRVVAYLQGHYHRVAIICLLIQKKLFPSM